MTDRLFHNAHEALTFAFRFAHDQSPRTPMTTLMQGGLIGSGKGLIGLDGAGQAGLILAALRHLNAEQRHVLVVRYGDIRRPCQCCGQDAPTAEWRIALDALSQCGELQDLPRAIRHDAVEKIVCRRKGLSVSRRAIEYRIPGSTVRDRFRNAKRRLTKVENSAVAWMDDHLQGRAVVELAEVGA